MLMMRSSLIAKATSKQQMQLKMKKQNKKNIRLDIKFMVKAENIIAWLQALFSSSMRSQTRPRLWLINVKVLKHCAQHYL